MRLHKKKGFTLAELLIVIAIIAVLVAIAIPVFSGALSKAQASVHLSNARAIHGEAMTKYLLDTSPSDKYTGTIDGMTYNWILGTDSAMVQHPDDCGVSGCEVVSGVTFSIDSGLHATP